MEACQKSETTEAASKSSKEVLSKMKVELGNVKADYAWERERTELDLANAKNDVAKVVVKFKTSKRFMAEKAQVVADFKKSEEFYTLWQDFGQESYKEGFNRGSRSAGRPLWIIS